jgi:hypothetical protein
MPREEGGVVIDLTDQAHAMSGYSAPVEDPWLKPPGLFGPGQPVLPVWPEEQPRLFEYQPGINLVSIPRAGFGLAPFPMLRNLAFACKEVRLNIELVKREVRALEWEIIPAQEGDKSDYAGDITFITRFLDAPDGEHDFDQWLNILLEEMLAVDALTIWPELDRAGQVVALEPVAGDTIRPLLDFRGRVAPPPLPAYIQVLHGLSRSYFERGRLIYRPFNASASSPYGTSPIEFIILTVNLAMRRDVFHVGEFTEGNIPEALVGAPASWSQSQIETWQQYWDALVAGNMAQQRRMRWVPLENGTQVPVYEFRKDDINQTPRDEWLMRVACWAFGNNPAEFGITGGQGLGGAGFTASMENIQYRSMLGPITQYLSRLFNVLIQDWLGKPWLKHRWIGLGPQEDQLQQAQIDEIYTRIGVYDNRYIQDRLGIPADLRPQPGANRGAYGLLPVIDPVNLPPAFKALAASGEGAAGFFRGANGQGKRGWPGYG